MNLTPRLMEILMVASSASLLAGVVLLVVALVGRRVGIDIRCRRCRHEYPRGAVIPPVCSDCGADISRTDALIDLTHGYVAVDCSSSKKGENMMSDIRGLLGSFPAMPLNAEVAPRSILTGWIAGEPLPTGLSLGEECEMKDPAEGGAVVKCQHQELRCDEIDKHLDAGKQVTKLALVFEDNLSFVLGDDLIVRKLKFLDGALDQLEHADEDGRRAELDARFALQSGEVRRLFLLLEEAFKLSKAD